MSNHTVLDCLTRWADRLQIRLICSGKKLDEFSEYAWPQDNLLRVVRHHRNFLGRAFVSFELDIFRIRVITSLRHLVSAIRPACFQSRRSRCHQELSAIKYCYLRRNRRISVCAHGGIKTVLDVSLLEFIFTVQQSVE